MNLLALVIKLRLTKTTLACSILFQEQQGSTHQQMPPFFHCKTQTFSFDSLSFPTVSTQDIQQRPGGCYLYQSASSVEWDFEW